MSMTELEREFLNALELQQEQLERLQSQFESVLSGLSKPSEKSRQIMIRHKNSETLGSLCRTCKHNYHRRDSNDQVIGDEICLLTRVRHHSAVTLCSQFENGNTLYG